MPPKTRNSGKDDVEDEGDEIETFQENKDQRSRITTYWKMLGPLTKHNFFTWDQNLLYLIYHATWDPAIIDRDRQRVDIPWDGEEEDDHAVATARRDAFALFRMAAEPGFRHLFHGIRPGDAKGAYTRIFNRFCVLTHGAQNALINELNTMTMANTGLNLEMYMAKLVEKHGILLKVQGDNTDPTAGTKLSGMLLRGVIKPEFSAVGLLLSMQPVHQLTWDTVTKALLDFAVDNDLTELTRKGSTLMINSATKKECRWFSKPGGCRRGDDCSFRHSGESPNQANNKRQDTKNNKGETKQKFPKGTCYNCGDPNHMRPACPTLPKNVAKSNGDGQGEGGPPLVRQFMMAAQPMSATLGSRVTEFMSSATTSSSLPEIIFDNETTEHFCNRMEYFIPGSLSSCTYKVGIGDKTKDMMVYQKGNVMVYPVGGPKFMLTNVLYAPKGPFTIISWRKFDEKGCRTVGYGGSFSIEAGLPKNGQAACTIFTAKIKDGDKLYHVDARLKKERHHGAPILVPKTIQASSKKNTSRPTHYLQMAATVSKQFNGVAIESGTKVSKSPSQNFEDSVKQLSVLNAAPLHDLHVDLGHHRKNFSRQEFGVPVTPKEVDLPVPSCLRRSKNKPAKTSKRKKKNKTPTKLVDEQNDIVSMSASSRGSGLDSQVVFEVDSGSFDPVLPQTKVPISTRVGDHLQEVVDRKTLALPKKSVGQGEYVTKVFEGHARVSGYLLNIKSPDYDKIWMAENLIGLIRQFIMPTFDYASASSSDWTYVSRHVKAVLYDQRVASLQLGMSRDLAGEPKQWPEPWHQDDATSKEGTHYPRGCLLRVHAFLFNKCQPITEDGTNLGDTDCKNERTIVRLLGAGRVFATKVVEFIKDVSPCKTPADKKITEESRVQQESVGLPVLMEGGNKMTDVLFPSTLKHYVPVAKVTTLLLVFLLSILHLADGQTTLPSYELCYTEKISKDPGKESLYGALPKEFNKEQGDWVANVQFGPSGWPPSGKFTQLGLDDGSLAFRGGFVRTPSSPKVFKASFVNSDFVVAGLYVDGSTFIANNENEFRRRTTTSVKDGFTGKIIPNPESFLQLQYEQFENDFGAHGLLLHQKHLEFVTELGLESPQPKITPTDVYYDNIPADVKILDVESKKHVQSCYDNATSMDYVHFDQLVTVGVDMSKPTEHLFERHMRYINSTRQCGLTLDYHSLRQGENCQIFFYVDSGLKGIFPNYGFAVFVAESDFEKPAVFVAGPDFKNSVVNGATAAIFYKNAVAITMHASTLTITRNCADALTMPLDSVLFDRLLQKLMGQRWVPPLLLLRLRARVDFISLNASSSAMSLLKMISSITTNLETTKKTSKDMAASSKGHGKGRLRPSISPANSLLMFRRILIFPLPDDYYSWPNGGNHYLILGLPRCKFIDHRHTVKVAGGPSVPARPTSIMGPAVPAGLHSV